MRENYLQYTVRYRSCIGKNGIKWPRMITPVEWIDLQMSVEVWKSADLPNSRCGCMSCVHGAVQ